MFICLGDFQDPTAVHRICRCGVAVMALICSNQPVNMKEQATVRENLLMLQNVAAVKKSLVKTVKGERKKFS